MSKLVKVDQNTIEQFSSGGVLHLNQDHDVVYSIDLESVDTRRIFLSGGSIELPLSEFISDLEAMTPPTTVSKTTLDITGNPSNYSELTTENIKALDSGLEVNSRGKYRCYVVWYTCQIRF